MRLKRLDRTDWPGQYTQASRAIDELGNSSANADAIKAIYHSLPLFEGKYIHMTYDSEWDMFTLNVYIS